MCSLGTSSEELLCKVAKYPFNWVDSNFDIAQLLCTEQHFNVVDFPESLSSQITMVLNFDPQEADCLLFCDPSVGRCWEASENSLPRCASVQGRQASSKFWIEVSHAM